MLIRLLLLIFLSIEIITAKRGSRRSSDVFSKIHKQFEPQKGMSELEESRIVGGSYTVIQNHPYTAALPNCGAVIVEKRWIMTAAHCYNENVTYVRVGSSFKNNGRKYKFKSFIVHPNFYVSDTGVPHNDLMMIKLAEPLEFNEKIQPIEIGTDDDIEVGHSATAIGFGRLHEEGQTAPMLKKVDLPIMKHKLCEDMYKNKYEISSSQFCAGYNEGRMDACQGDSGGPLVINNRLIGLTSFGEGCARPNSPGVFVRVPMLKPWIDYIIKNA